MGICGSFARIPVCVRSGFAFIYIMSDRNTEASPTLQRSPFGSIRTKDFSARLSSRFHEVVFVPDSSWIVLPYNFAIHLLPERRSFLAQNFINTYPTFITFEYFIEHPLSEIAMSRHYYGCFFINLQGMVYCKNMI